MKDKIIEWLYVNDGKFPNKNEWRKAFVKFLDELEKSEDKKYFDYFNTIINKSK
jgi:hypothetical protein